MIVGGGGTSEISASPAEANVTCSHWPTGLEFAVIGISSATNSEPFQNR